jgi:hypothetical protein
MMDLTTQEADEKHVILALLRQKSSYFATSQKNGRQCCTHSNRESVFQNENKDTCQVIFIFPTQR